jgi:hypothetical protein
MKHYRVWQCGLTLAILCLLTGTSAAQTMTIPEIVQKRGPEPYSRSMHVDAAPSQFEEVVRAADLIVQASLRKLRTYLSDDQQTLYTDYELLPITVIASSRPESSSKPGMPDLVLRQWGGETTIAGVPVRIDIMEFPLLPENAPLLLFLTWNEEISRYQIFEEITGAFSVDSEQRLTHLLRSKSPWYERFRGMGLSQAVSEIRKLRRP